MYLKLSRYILIVLTGFDEDMHRVYDDWTNNNKH